MVIEKNTIQQVFGGLMRDPSILSQKDKYNLSLADFSNRFEMNIFYAITGLYSQGARRLAPIDIANFLESNTTHYNFFIQNNGIEYLNDAFEFSANENFLYYYNRLKKLNLLRDLQKKGIDTSKFYEENPLKKGADEINAKFEDLTVADICTEIKKTVLSIENSYNENVNNQSWELANEVDDVIDSFGAIENIGLSINGNLFTKVINGAETYALTIRSLASGIGKTRLAVADACKLAYPFYYDTNTNRWVKNGGTSERVLFIMTEQTVQQVIKMILAYLTGINESKFRHGNLTEEENRRIDQARQIIKRYNTLKLMRIPDPNVEIIKLAVREKVIADKIQYLFFDYIFISPNLLNEFRGNIRNDEALLLMATALKDLAVEFGLSVFTSTQVNAKADDNRDIRNEASLAGGRSTINKADNGIIGSRPTADEIEILNKSEFFKNCGIPNIVFDVFKVRSGRWTQIRIWSIFDAGTLRLQDLFVTDSRFNPITEIENEMEMSWEGDEQDINLLTELNSGLIIQNQEPTIQEPVETKEKEQESPSEKETNKEWTIKELLII